MAQFIRGASTERYCNSVVQKHSRPPHKAHSEMVSNWHRCWMSKPQLQVELLEFCHTHGTDNPKYLQKQKIRKTENVKICHTSSVYHPTPPPPPPTYHHHHPLRAYQLLVGYGQVWKGEL